MRKSLVLLTALLAAAALPASAQDAFDACTVFTQEDAERALQQLSVHRVGTAFAPAKGPVAAKAATKL